MDAESTYQLGRFAELYRAVPKVQRLRDLGTEEYKAFMASTGSPVGVVSSRDHAALLPLIPEFLPFYREAQLFWLVPCEVPGREVVGFVLRALTVKVYRSFHVKDAPPLIWGLHNLETHHDGAPVVVTEGIKDAIYLNRLYPYVLAFLTNYITDFHCQMLGKITKRVVLAFDSDEGGDKARKFVTPKLARVGVVIANMLPKGTKDFGQYFTYPAFEEDAKRQLRSAMRNLRWPPEPAPA